MINDQDIDGLAHRYVLASRRLEIGPGDCPLVGEWDTLDSHPIPSVPLTYVAKWGLERLPIEDCSYDLVFSSHAIEHIPWYHAQDALREVCRIVRPGGAFEVWTVDFAVVVEYYLSHRMVGDWDCGGRISNYMQSVSGRVFAYEKNGSPWMWHKALFDRPYLRSLLLGCGFDRVEDLRQTRGHDHGVINMGVVAFKNSLVG